MTIENQLGRTGAWNLSPDRYVEGQIVSGDAWGIPVAIPWRRPTWELVGSGDIGDGVYAFDVTADDGTTLTASVTRSAGVVLDSDPSIPLDTIGDVLDQLAANLIALSGGLELIETALVDTDTLEIVGRIAGRVLTIDEVIVPDLVAEAHTITVVGNDDGLYRIALQVGEEASQNIDATGSTSTIEEIRDQLSAAAAALDPAPDVTFGEVSTNAITIVSNVAGVPLTIVLTQANDNLTDTTDTANVGFALVATQTVDALGQPIPIGRFVVVEEIDGARGVRLPISTDTAASIAGVCGRSHTMPPRQASAPIGEVIEHEVGQVIVPIERVEQLALTNHGSVASTVRGKVYVVINTAGGQEAGLARADADGSNTVDPTTITARWCDVVAPGELGLVRITR